MSPPLHYYIIQAMKAEIQRKERVNKERVMVLMKECSANRRAWIIDSEPTVIEVYEKFPALEDHTVVNSE